MRRRPRLFLSGDVPEEAGRGVVFGHVDDAGLRIGHGGLVGEPPHGLMGMGVI